MALFTKHPSDFLHTEIVRTTKEILLASSAPPPGSKLMAGVVHLASFSLIASQGLLLIRESHPGDGNCRN